MARLPRLRRERPINAENPPPGTTTADSEPKAAHSEAKTQVLRTGPAAPAVKPSPPAKPSSAGAGPVAPEKRKKESPAVKPAEKDAKTDGGKKAAKRAKTPRAPRKPIKLTPRAKLAVAAVAGAAVAVALLALTGTLGSDDGQSVSPPAPVTSSGSSGSGAQTATALGFPAFATRNTTRVGGGDPASNAAGVALAAFPSTGGARSPVAVSLVSGNDWQTGIAASSLVAPPLGIPVLISSPDGVPDVTKQALAALAPRGGALSGGTQAFTFGEASAPDDLRERPVLGDDPAALAADIDRLRTELTGEEPAAILVTTSEFSEFAMPAASYAARSGDPVLFTGSKKLPGATARALGNHRGVPVYVLGPPSAIPDAVLGEIKDASGSPPVRISGEDPVSNAIAFARYSQGNFGWDINDPGHGFVVTRSDQPMDAAASAALSATGTWGPLLLTDSADVLPGALRGYRLDVQPGYQDDPTRAYYNHVWIIGDEEAISVDQQAAIDELAELTQIGVPEPATPPAGRGPSGATPQTGATGASGASGATGSTGGKP